LFAGEGWSQDRCSALSRSSARWYDGMGWPSRTAAGRSNSAIAIPSMRFHSDSRICCLRASIFSASSVRNSAIKGTKSPHVPSAFLPWMRSGALGRRKVLTAISREPTSRPARSPGPSPKSRAEPEMRGSRASRWM